MVLALMVSLLASAPPDPASALRSDDPPIKVSLNQDNYFERGDRARVKVRTAGDGYVVVLRSDAQGRVRVLFPLDPSDDDFVRGGRTLEVRGRGDREAFYIDDGEGSGVVLAARSAAPFKFEEFVRGDHWDYRVLGARDGDDKEQALLDIVQRMVPDGHFDYDAVHYTVAAPGSYYSGYNHYYSPFGWRRGFRYGYGWPSYGSGCRGEPCSAARVMHALFRSRHRRSDRRARAIRGQETTAPGRRRAAAPSLLSAGLRRRAARSGATPVAVGITRVTAAGSGGVEAEGVVVAVAAE